MRSIETCGLVAWLCYSTLMQLGHHYEDVSNILTEDVGPTQTVSVCMI